MVNSSKKSLSEIKDSDITYWRTPPGFVNDFGASIAYLLFQLFVTPVEIVLYAVVGIWLYEVIAWLTCDWTKTCDNEQFSIFEQIIKDWK